MKRTVSAEIYKLSIFRKHEIFEIFELGHQLFGGGWITTPTSLQK